MGHILVWRTIILTLCFLLNLAVLGLIAHYLVFTIIPPSGPFIYSFQILGLVVGVFTLLFIPALMNGKITVIFDLVVMFLLWVLWLAESILAVGHLQGFFKDLRTTGRRAYTWYASYGYDSSPRINTQCTRSIDVFCYEIYVIQNLVITIFVLSFIHFIGLLIYAVLRQRRGQPIWKTYIRYIDQPQYPVPMMQPQMPWQVVAMPVAPVAYYPNAHLPVNQTWPGDPNGKPQEPVAFGKETTNL